MLEAMLNVSFLQQQKFIRFDSYVPMPVVEIRWRLYGKSAEIRLNLGNSVIFNPSNATCYNASTNTKVNNAVVYTGSSLYVENVTSDLNCEVHFIRI